MWVSTKTKFGLIQKLGEARKTSRVPKKRCNRIPRSRRNQTCINLSYPLHWYNSNFFQSHYLHIFEFYSNHCNYIVCPKVYINELRIVFFIILFRQDYWSSKTEWPIVPHSPLISCNFKRDSPISGTLGYSLLLKATPWSGNRPRGRKSSLFNVLNQICPISS